MKRVEEGLDGCVFPSCVCVRACMCVVKGDTALTAPWSVESLNARTVCDSPTVRAQAKQTHTHTNTHKNRNSSCTAEVLNITTKHRQEIVQNVK